MRGIRPVLGLVMGAIALAGCGSTQAGQAAPEASTPKASTSASSTTRPSDRDRDRPPGPGGPVAAGRGPTFPLTLRRTGGIAGFDDTVVLKPTGEVLVETRTVHGRVCVLRKPERERLFTVLATLRQDAGSAPAIGAESEIIRISLTDAHRHPFDLADPSLGSVSDMVGAFVADVTLSSPTTVRCTSRPA